MFGFNFFRQIFNFFIKNKEINIDTKQIIEIKKKIEYMEADMAILTEQYRKLLDRTKANEMTEGRANKKQDQTEIQSLIMEIIAAKGQNLDQILLKHSNLVQRFLK